MKTNKLMLALILSSGITSALAANSFPVASGTISSISRNGKVALTMMQSQPNYYDITCLITGTNTETSPASIQPLLTLPVPPAGFAPYFMYYDGVNISPSGMGGDSLVIKDGNPHKLTVTIYGLSITADSEFDFKWVSGNASSTINYSCSAVQRAEVKGK